MNLAEMLRTLRLSSSLSRCALLAVCATLAYGQSDQARIVGTISDVTGAVIPGASVTVKNSKTGQSRKVETNSEGRYIVTQLLPAPYTVTAEATGMAAANYTDINLEVGQERTINVTLQPAATTTEVTVSGGQLVTIDTSSARIGANVSEREVANLPLNGRQVSQLYLMAAAAGPSTTSASTARPTRRTPSGTTASRAATSSTLLPAT
jgi:Carboxypeptidase regulatory-like domain